MVTGRRNSGVGGPNVLPTVDSVTTVTTRMARNLRLREKERERERELKELASNRTRMSR